MYCAFGIHLLKLAKILLMGILENQSEQHTHYLHGAVKQRTSIPRSTQMHIRRIKSMNGLIITKIISVHGSVQIVPPSIY
mmetsp:Transcript_6080/g.10519  ORF Transcript_6080/g.10519 Transcript_6080/m.10519 type:complete len:80 (+) Transcript_6080:268-507(+)